ncbi:hypothetical protein JW898_00475 [Candidatus Woesearchaeota archaeon]|nr:hypothetical protein [Candidatus Woesearchaeota archaeon]
MPVLRNPFRIHSGWVCWSHGLRVLILRNSQRFWVAYKELLELNGKKESDINELKDVMERMRLTPNEKRKLTDKARDKMLAGVINDFDDALSELNEMFGSLRDIIYADETLLFRTVVELGKVYHKFSRVDHIPDHMREGVLNSIYSLMGHMRDFQQHMWIVSKAHARDFIKVSEMTFLSSRGERRRIRIQTIELDHMRNRIEPLREWVDRLGKVRTHEDIHALHEKITELLELYHKEVKHMKHIIHEAHVLTRRTEKLFKGIEHEAHSLGAEAVVKRLRAYSLKFHRIHDKLEKQARREYFDVAHIVDSLPKPGKVVQGKKAKVVSLGECRKKQEEAAHREEVKKAA